MKWDEANRELNRIEEEREDIQKEIRTIDRELDEFDEVQREMKEFFKDVWRHCEDQCFIRRMELCEEEIYSCAKKDEEILLERKEELERQKRETFYREETLREKISREEISDRK